MGAAMDSIKGAFSKMGHGVADVGHGVASAAHGVGELGKGIATGDLSGIKKGAKDFFDSADGVIKGAAGIVGGALGAATAASPVGAAINHMTHGGASRLVEGAADSVGSTLIKGRHGVGKMVEGAETGDWKKAAHGALDLGKSALLFTPAAGADAGAAVAGVAGKMAKSGAGGAAFDQAKAHFTGGQSSASLPGAADAA